MTSTCFLCGICATAVHRSCPTCISYRVRFGSRLSRSRSVRGVGIVGDISYRVRFGPTPAPGIPAAVSVLLTILDDNLRRIWHMSNIGIVIILSLFACFFRYRTYRTRLSFGMRHCYALISTMNKRITQSEHSQYKSYTPKSF